MTAAGLIALARPWSQKESALVLSVLNQHRFNAEANGAPKLVWLRLFIQVIAFQLVCDNGDSINTCVHAFRSLQPPGRQGTRIRIRFPSARAQRLTGLSYPGTMHRALSSAWFRGSRRDMMRSGSIPPKRPAIEALCPYVGSSCALDNHRSSGTEELCRRLRSVKPVCSEPWGFRYGLAQIRTENPQVMGRDGNTRGNCRYGPPLPDELLRLCIHEDGYPYSCMSVSTALCLTFSSPARRTSL